MEIINPSDDDNAQEAIDKGYNVEGSRYIEEGYQLFKKNIGYFVGYTLLLAIAEAALSSSDHRANIISLIYPVFTAGYYIIASKLDRNEEVEFVDFFKGLNKFLPLFLAGLLITLFVVFGMVLFIIPGIYLAVGYSLAMSIIVFQNKDFWEAMETSRKVITKEWSSFFLFTLMLLAINIIGFLCLIVGLLVSIPVSYLAVYSAYKHIINRGEVPVSTC